MKASGCARRWASEMPTKRTKRQPQRIGITTAAAEGWRAGDWHTVNRELGVPVCDWSPFDVTDGPPPSWLKGPWQLRSWRRGQQLRQALLEFGPPGVYDRHGAPLGPAPR
jgi:hypothetical protein